MDAHYQPLYRQAAALQHKYQDYSHGMGMAHDPAAMAMRNEIHSLTNDLAMSKSPQAIERRLRTIQKQIRNQQVRNPVGNVGTMGAPGAMGLPGSPATGSSFLKTNQANYLHSNFETMRRNVTQHPHF